MYDIIVVGAGLAGSSVSIHLASCGVKVLLLERGQFPRHKVCGEFLSVEVASMLQRLGVAEQIVAAGATRIQKVRITSASRDVWEGLLPGVAYGLSRYRLDQLLFERASKSGANTLAGVNVSGISGNLDEGFTVDTSVGPQLGRMVIGAFGKKSGLNSTSKRKGTAPCDDFVAFKEHYLGTLPDHAVEVHAFDRGYCGVNTIEDGLTNVCWLAKRSLLTEYGGQRETVAGQVMMKNHQLAERLSGLERVPGTLCAIGGVSLSSRGQFHNDILLVGDSAQMIAPFCGDGMGMALRSGEIAAQTCLYFLSSSVSRNMLKREYRKRWNHEFAERLVLGRLLQSAVLSENVAAIALRVLNLSPALGNWMVNRTRGSDRNYVGWPVPNSSKHPSIVRPGPNPSAMPE